MLVEKCFSGMMSDRTRLRMVERLAQSGISDPRVLAAMRMIPRHLFVDEVLGTRAYDDVSLPIGRGQTISHPYTVAFMTELLLRGRKIDKALEIGTGCGYQTAVLMAAGVNNVYSIERIKSLLTIAQKNLRKLNMIKARLTYGDGQFGLKEAAPFDAILITASAEKVPSALIDQLAEGGRMVLPVGQRDDQSLWYFEKKQNTIVQKNMGLVKFVPLLYGKI